LAQGLDLMRWTFDPLESRNAYFNVHKLGAICRSYRPDYYGPMEDSLNRDLPSDRLLVEWRLRDSGWRLPLTVSPHSILHNRNGVPELRLDGAAPEGPIAIDVPRDLQSIKRESPEVALAWRHAVRQAFTVSFSRGYVVCDFRDGAYILRQEKECGE
jgi:predicted GNAT superfamily acetyltransferase